MRILFLQPNWNYHDTIYPNLGSVYPYQPLDMCYIISLIKEYNEIFFIDAFLENMSFSEVACHVKNIEPEILILPSANTFLFWRCCFPDLEVVTKTVKTIKRSTVKKPKFILYGPHGTVSPEWTLKKTGVDILFRGEPEEAIQQFFDKKTEDFAIKGLYTLKHTQNGIAFISDMKNLPVPDFNILKTGKYYCHSWITDENLDFERGAILEFSRGCPYHCAFCFRAGFRGKYRIKPAEKMIKEILFMKEHHSIDYIFFIDDIFNINNNNTRVFLENMKGVGVSFGCQCRPDIMTKEMVDQMAAAGCIYIEYGLESLNQENRMIMKKNENLLSVMRIINYTKKKVPHVVFNLLDFSTLNTMTDGYKTRKNEHSLKKDTFLALSSDTDALEPIVIFPKTAISRQVAEKMKIKEFTWLHTIRLYWLQEAIKDMDKNQQLNYLLWKLICLYFPFPLAKLVVRIKKKLSPNKITFARKMKIEKRGIVNG